MLSSLVKLATDTGLAPATQLGLPQVTISDAFKSVTGYLFAIGGGLAVIMIIVSGLMYVTSAGNPASVARAKNTALFSVIGLLIVIAAFAIVQFVTGAF